jgi:hypothetical protein
MRWCVDTAKHAMIPQPRPRCSARVRWNSSVISTLDQSLKTLDVAARACPSDCETPILLRAAVSSPTASPMWAAPALAYLVGATRPARNSGARMDDRAIHYSIKPDALEHWQGLRQQSQGPGSFFNDK